MPSTTNTDRLIGVERSQAVFEAYAAEKLQSVDDAADRLREEVKLMRVQLESASQRIAVLEQRCLHMEGHSNRQWQVWLALIGALLAVAVSIFKR